MANRNNNDRGGFKELVIAGFGFALGSLFANWLIKRASERHQAPPLGGVLEAEPNEGSLGEQEQQAIIDRALAEELG